MYGNGAAIGTIKIIIKAVLLKTPEVLLQAALAFCAAALGAITAPLVAWCVASMMNPRPATRLQVFGWFGTIKLDHF